jgi:hypothetical protein
LIVGDFIYGVADLNGEIAIRQYDRINEMRRTVELQLRRGLEAEHSLLEE